MNKPKSKKAPNIWQIALSTIAAAFGVQSRRNQERDFEHGSIAAYIIAGVLFTLVFIGCVAFVVSRVLAHHGL
ncbi:DUF2970 domain-containing protein [Eionea flava]